MPSDSFPRDDVTRDFRWQRRFIPEMKYILAQHLIVEAPFVEDAKHNTDLVVLEARLIRVACRVRRAPRYPAYRDEFTIRAWRKSGVPTELDKIEANWGDVFFYAFASEDSERIDSWFAGSLRVFRRWNLDCLKKNGRSPGRLIPNRDGNSKFRLYHLDELPADFVFARSPAAPVSVDRFTAEHAAPAAQSATFTDCSQLAFDELEFFANVKGPGLSR